ncbi:MAG: hypothetical protein KDA17_07390 [Candidatus Saccharibacteria bacterium]|nr:hypothetical protein [Candidatus Saccharibacteria bacterium]
MKTITSNQLAAIGNTFMSESKNLKEQSLVYQHASPLLENAVLSTALSFANIGASIIEVAAQMNGVPQHKIDSLYERNVIRLDRNAQ